MQGELWRGLEGRWRSGGMKFPSTKRGQAQRGREHDSRVRRAQLATDVFHVYGERFPRALRGWHGDEGVGRAAQ